MEEAYVGCSLAKVLTKHGLPLLGGFELDSRPGILARLNFHDMDVPLIGCELTGVPDPGQRLVG